jgi:hypothetical protein
MALWRSAASLILVDVFGGRRDGPTRALSGCDDDIEYCGSYYVYGGWIWCGGLVEKASMGDGVKIFIFTMAKSRRSVHKVKLGRVEGSFWSFLLIQRLQSLV